MIQGHSPSVEMYSRSEPSGLFGEGLCSFDVNHKMLLLSVCTDFDDNISSFQLHWLDGAQMLWL